MCNLHSGYTFYFMATITRTIRYCCSDDCKQSGCPSHEAILEYQSVTDSYRFDNGKGYDDSVKYFERGELESFIRLLKQLNRADAINIEKL